MYLELRHLRAVKAIHDAGGLARAAERLNLTQPAISRTASSVMSVTTFDAFLGQATHRAPAGVKTRASFGKRSFSSVRLFTKSMMRS